MIRTLSFALIALVLMGLPAFAADSGRMSGHVLEVKDGGQTLVLLEQGPWYGPNTGLFKRTIALAPGTSVRLVRSTGEWANDASPGYEARPMDLKDLKHGDFVTVTAGAGRAASVEVMLPSEAGLASPKLELKQR
jgi:hypothetical protein